MVVHRTRLRSKMVFVAAWIPARAGMTVEKNDKIAIEDR